MKTLESNLTMCWKNNTTVTSAT